ncbi:MAG: hypothetical protein AB8C84_11120 [Oligoflexales bacterium]
MANIPSKFCCNLSNMVKAMLYNYGIFDASGLSVDQSQDLSCTVYKAAREEQQTFYELFKITRIFFLKTLYGVPRRIFYEILPIPKR